MKIINKTKNAILAEDVIIADTPFKRMKGLLGRKEFNKGEALVIKPCNSIHMFFMRFPIDVLFVNKEDEVTAAVNRIKPWRFSRPYFNACYAIELSAGVIESSHTVPGDKLYLE